MLPPIRGALSSSLQWRTWDSHGGQWREVVSSALAPLPGVTVTIECDYIASPT
jgi:hypothetical protein